MEMALQPPKPLFCRMTLFGRTRFEIRPATESLLWCKEFKRVMAPIAASSEYSRRRPRRSSIPRTKGSPPRGFAPRPQVGTGIQKKDQSDVEAKEESENTSSSKYSLSSSEFNERKVAGEEQTTELDAGGIPGSAVKRRADILEEVEEESYGEDDKDQKTCTRMPSAAADNYETDGQRAEDEGDRVGLRKQHLSVLYSEKEIKEQEVTGVTDEVGRQMLERLAEGNFSSGNKVFVVPEVVKSDEVIEIFFNRSLSALMNEPDVLIKGAFNGWRWKFFTEKMHKTDLRGDWWSCQLYVPKEAYKIDFVFFNSANIYENNDSKDFSLLVEGEMDELAFEDILLEVKRRELEKLAAEEAERERQDEEQRRREAEKAANEADKAQAKVEVQKKREALHRVMKLAKPVDDVWHIEPSVFKGGDMVRLYYNRSSCPLAHATEIWIHGGHNNWIHGLSIAERLLRSDKKDGDWWYAEVAVPDHALVLDWVFANGPPQKANIYDNNNSQDFHATVPNCMLEDLFWVEEEHRIYRKLQEERKLKEEAVRKKAEKTARLKAETKERTMKMFLLSQKHIVYTEPLDVRAGSMVTVFYNPSNTVLSGKPEVWFRCSFNRWTHHNGPLPPQKMVHAHNGSHVKVTEREDGGIYDNKNGMDYHIPVSGGILKEPATHIVHIAVEMAPIAKVGGLGDVVTSLSRAVQDLGHNVDIILPKYDCMNLSNVKDFHFHQSFGWGGTEVKVWFGKVEGLSVYFLEPHNGMFSVGCIYGRNDGDRFGFFCHAALEFLFQSGSCPDILHCHDWSSAPVAWLFKEHYRHDGLSNARVVFTIHNLEYGVHHIGKAMTHADKATTVSPTYSKEVSGNPAISPHLFKFHGILNGIDLDIWDPFNDNFIPVSYTSENVVEGKKAAKEALQQRFGLRKSDLPLVGIITRLTVQKGIHLIKHAIGRTLDRNGQVVLLGSAPDPRIQNDFVNLANQVHSSHADRVRLCLTYDEPLSHLIYAGADFILVPSLFEPCGLTQLIAMRYGSIPVVRKTGGLCDTVFDVDNDKQRAHAQDLEPNGFSFDGADPSGLDYALNRAISAWFDGREWFNSLCKRVMEQDWSWNRPALEYMELYHIARK
ncbi:starch synthase 3, chloroplastic/amyloplastic isoform X2 [Phoenix dactylifera]|uniref:starch synthase n=1 Tax=Phoenix dactylifera TaxID=42345 RepID=A0A8B8Z8L0_PHODC|nr:starch synthase 3, chloroplastic/amyloplastic isoform X2 [Phoenix dactylifera]